MKSEPQHTAAIQACEQAKVLLQENEAQLRALLSALPLPAVIMRLADSVILDLNDRAGEFFHLVPEKAIGMHMASLYSAQAECEQQLAQLRAETGTIEFETCMLRGDECGAWTWIASTPVIYDGQPVVLSVYHDISFSRRLADELRKSEAFYRALFNISKDGIILTDMERHIHMASPAACRLFGCEEHEIIGQDVLALPLREADRIRGGVHFSELLGGKENQTEEVVALGQGGEELGVEINGEVMRDADGNFIGMLFLLRDITDRKRLEDELCLMSYRDKLTGLYNRRYFENEILRLNHSRMYPISVLVADVDGLKAINDEYGTGTGDDYLVMVAGILTQAFRAEDAVARVGDDEFAVILPGTTAQIAANIRQRLAEKINAADAGSTDFPIGISVGVATSDGTSESLEETFARADAAMYEDKHARKAQKTGARTV